MVLRNLTDIRKRRLNRQLHKASAEWQVLFLRADEIGKRYE